MRLRSLQPQPRPHGTSAAKLGGAGLCLWQGLSRLEEDLREPACARNIVAAGAAFDRFEYWLACLPRPRVFYPSTSRLAHGLVFDGMEVHATGTAAMLPVIASGTGTKVNDILPLLKSQVPRDGWPSQHVALSVLSTWPIMIKLIQEDEDSTSRKMRAQCC